MVTYFNEHDSFAAEWLRNLYPAAMVDERSIHDVQASDLVGFTRCHFFGGIGGWELALELAGWRGPVWTGSCPCQPYSSAGKGKGDDDARNLWPEMFRLIRECRPAIVFGEQVEAAIKHGWLDGICRDLEGEGYAVGAHVLGAHSVGSPHIRQRLYWVACTGHGQRRRADECGPGSDGQTQRHEEANHAERCGVGGVEQSPGDGRGGERVQDGRAPEVAGAGPWDGSILIPCRDGKARRVSSQSGDEPLAYGVPRGLGSGKPELRRLAARARGNRVGRLRGYGNAIVPQVAAVFIHAVVEGILKQQGLEWEGE